MENRYDKYKDSGIAWVGEIPEHWDKNKIIRLFSIIGSGTTPKSSKEDNYIGSVNWIQSGDINGGYIENCKNTISDTALKEYPTLKIYKAPFIIVAMYGASVGNISISNIDGCVNQACCVMNETKQNFKYLFYAMNSVKRYLIYKAEGGGQPNISQDKIKNTWMPIPPFEEQQSIATYLDQKCGEIDELITLQEEIITKLQSYKQSVITEAVTKGLDKNVPLKDSGIEWIGEIPEHWSLVSIGKLFNIYAGGDAKPDYYSNTKDLEHPFPVYTNTRSEHEIYAYTSKAIFPANTITVTGRGDVGHAIYRRTPYDSIIRLLSLIPKNNYDCRFYTYFIDIVIPFMDGKSAVAQLSALQLKPQLVCLPSNEEQQSIADYLDRKCSEIDELISIKQQKIEKLKNYKNSLIFECVTGKRKV